MLDSFGQHLQLKAKATELPTVKMCKGERTNFESSWAPIDELDGPFGLDGCDGSIDILGHHIATEQQTTGHVLAMTRITFHHLVGWLETSVRDLGYCELELDL